MLSQFANPALHDWIAQLPKLHAGVPLGVKHTWPQLLQLLGLLKISISQPFAAALSQSANPLLHDWIPQVPKLHAGFALGVEHTWPQLRQLLESFRIFISQPFAAVLSQSANPALHDWIPQVPELHAGFAFGMEHAWPQLLQLLGLLKIFVSQPFATM